MGVADHLVQTHTRVAIEEASAVGEARRVALSLCDELPFDAADAGRVALVVTEASSNIVRHAGGEGGELLLRVLDREGVPGLEILALDRGAGMRHVGDCLRDGYTTAGSRGVGLGAMVRQSDLFDLHSSPGQGTALLMHVYPGERAADRQVGALGVVSVAHRDEDLSGDAWSVRLDAGRSALLVVDGLGHGPEAHAASMAALRSFERNAGASPEEIMVALHGALRATRGAVAAVSAIDWSARELHYAGIGNIASRLIGGDDHTTGLVSHHGTLGRALGQTRGFVHAWPDGGLLVMHSDGVSRRWELADYPGLVMKHPTLIAAVLYRDFGRRRDDALVVVAREPTRAVEVDPRVLREDV